MISVQVDIKTVLFGKISAFHLNQLLVAKWIEKSVWSETVAHAYRKLEAVGFLESGVRAQLNCFDYTKSLSERQHNFATLNFRSF